MLGNCEKMVLISSSANQWPQMKNQTTIDHDQKGLNLMGSTAGIMDKPAAAAAQDQKPQQKQHQEPLRCPRCDSSNTKFCYYNNYSLSQPRHFCKACKRYWTKGGTLRNVPVGGGCRKNKRVKRPTTTTHSSSSPAATTNNFDHPDSTSSSSTSCANNPLPNPPIFYGLPTNSTSDLNLPLSGYDHHLQPHLNALGLGFSSANIDHRDFNLNGFNNSNINLNSSSLLSSYSSIFGNPSSTSLSSLLASKFTNGGGFKEIRSAPNLFENLASPFDHHHQELHVIGSNGSDQQVELTTANMKEVKLEEGMKRLEWEVGSNQQNQTDEIVGQSNDPNSLYSNWSSTWHDPANLGSSITSSLI